MKPGETYLLEGHLWVVVSLPGADGSVAMVNFTSYREPCDESCILQPGDHSFIKRKTIVQYGWGTMVSPAMQKKVQEQPQYEDVSGSVLDRIQQGALKSQATSFKIAKAIEDTLAKKAKK